MLLGLASGGCYAVNQTMKMDEDTKTLSRIFLAAAQNFGLKKNRKIVEAFVRKDVVDINVHFGDGWTAAKYAAYSGSPKIVTFLAENGANLNISKGGETVLDVAHRSLLQGKPKEERISYLKEKGAKTNEQLVLERLRLLAEKENK